MSLASFDESLGARRTKSRLGRTKMARDSHILVIDGMNLLHRARGGFKKGDHPIAFNFFRGLRPMIELFKPDECFFVLEGHPERNLALLPEYKATRQPMPEADDFIRQVDEVVSLLKRAFPLRVFQHPRYEADDVVANICRRWKDDANGLSITVVSSDSDFIQLLQQHTHVRLWNWRKKAYEQAPEHDYVSWKALRGDGTDNIPGVPGVGDRTAEMLLKDGPSFLKRMEDPVNRSIYERNLQLVRFFELTDEEDEELMELCCDGHASWDEVRRMFELWGFRSMTAPGPWEKYVMTFEGL